MAVWYKSLDRKRFLQIFANDTFFAAAYFIEKKNLKRKGLR